MKLTELQKQQVEENMGLVGKVIRNRVHGLGQRGMPEYEELFQIGCIGLCKAAATDKGGHFSTYAYRLIWNEICDYLIKVNRLSDRECSFDDEVGENLTYTMHPSESLDATLNLMCSGAAQSIRNGVQVLRYLANGYSYDEIALRMKTKVPTLRQWVSRARKALRQQPTLKEMVADE